MFELKFVAFCLKFSADSYLKFQEKTISWEFFRNFVQTKAILYRNLWNFALLSAILFWFRIALKKIDTSTFTCCLHPIKEAGPQKNHKEKIWERKARTFCFRKTSFVHSRSGTHYSLLLGYFGLKLLPDIRHCVYWVSAEIWAPNSSHKICNKYFIHHCQCWKEASFVWETVWFLSLVNTHRFDLKFVAFCPKFSWDSYLEFQEKTILGEYFRNFVQTKAILYRNMWNFALLSAILFRVCIALKKIHTSTFTCYLHPGMDAGPEKNN